MNQLPERTEFWLTFNHPAVREYFNPDHDGVRIKKVEARAGNKIVQTLAFKSCPDYERHDDAAEVQPRSVGVTGHGAGFKLVINGSKSATYCDLLFSLGGGKAHPFFLLEEMEDGWVKIARLYTGGFPTPPKTEPHLRFWPRKNARAEALQRHHDAATQPIHTELPALPQQANDALLGSVVTRLRQARAVSSDHDKSQRPEAPAPEIHNAEDMVRGLGRLAQDLEPRSFFHPLAEDLKDAGESLLEIGTSLAAAALLAERLQHTGMRLVAMSREMAALSIPAQSSESALATRHPSPEPSQGAEPIQAKLPASQAAQDLGSSTANHASDPVGGSAAPSLKITRVDEGVSGIQRRKRALREVTSKVRESPVPAPALVIAQESRPPPVEQAIRPFVRKSEDLPRHGVVSASMTPPSRSVTFLDPDRIDREIRAGRIIPQENWRGIPRQGCR